MNKKIEQLFAEYEKAFANLDFRKTASFFSDTFISAGPRGSISANKQDFLDKAEKAVEFYRSIGQTSAKVLSIHETSVNNQYTMAKVYWGVTFKKTGNQVIEFDVSYLVEDVGPEPRIILFIAHEDEETAMKNLGLLQN